MRESGILFHITSLSSPYGIGTLGKNALDFVDFLKKSGQKYWQVLPIGPTSYGDSPYQSLSVFAGNPYFIDLDLLIADGLLLQEECDCFKVVSDKVDYETLYNTRFLLFKKAYQRFINQESKKEFAFFKEEKSFWLNDYALFMAIKKEMNDLCWLDWDEGYKKRDPKTLEKFIENHYEEIDYWKFIQYIFFKQWLSLKEYANNNNVKIIGDMPIYVALDSADVWSDPKNWLLDEELKPREVSGVPPDYFSKTGQLWGNPLYDYDEMKKNNYSWWVKRIKESFELFDALRIDHFRGFESYYAIPYKEITAINGKWRKGPGIDLFNTIKQELGKKDIIAEDLGLLTKEVYDLLRESGFPGMKVMQFGFNPNDDSEHLPHNYKKHMVAYTGTHDNATLKEWLESCDKNEFCFVCDYLNLDYESSIDTIIDRFITILLASVSERVIIPLTDYLHLGSSARFNTPSVLGNNWSWRLESEKVLSDISNKIYKFTKTYKRI